MFYRQGYLFGHCDEVPIGKNMFSKELHIGAMNYHHGWSPQEVFSRLMFVINAVRQSNPQIKVQTYIEDYETITFKAESVEELGKLVSAFKKELKSMVEKEVAEPLIQMIPEPLKKILVEKRLEGLEEVEPEEEEGEVGEVGEVGEAVEAEKAEKAEEAKVAEAKAEASDALIKDNKIKMIESKSLPQQATILIGAFALLAGTGLLAFSSSIWIAIGLVLLGGIIISASCAPCLSQHSFFAAPPDERKNERKDGVFSHQEIQVFPKCLNSPRLGHSPQ